MSNIELVGVDGSNPLGFLAALGLLRVVPGAKLGFSDDGSFRAFIDGLDKSNSDLATLIAADAEAAVNERAPWRFTYTKRVLGSRFSWSQYKKTSTPCRTRFWGEAVEIRGISMARLVG